jgi:hypothetical protein
MRKQTIIILAILVFTATALSGCNKPDDTKTEGIIETYDPPNDLDIKDFRLKFSGVESTQFNYSDTAMPNRNYYYYVKSQRQSVVLEGLHYHYNETPYDMIFMDRSEEMAYAWCSNRFCDEIDRRAEEVNYSDYDILDPRELAYSVKSGKILRKEYYTTSPIKGQVHTHIVFVIKFEDFDGNTGTMWVQSYYMLPLKAVYDNGRVIEYKNIFWNTVRDYYIDLPIVVRKLSRAKLLSSDIIPPEPSIEEVMASYNLTNKTEATQSVKIPLDVSLPLEDSSVDSITDSGNSDADIVVAS